MNFSELKTVQFGETDGKEVYVPILSNDGDLQRVFAYPCSPERGPAPNRYREVHREPLLREATPVEKKKAYDNAYAFWIKHKHLLLPEEAR